MLLIAEWNQSVDAYATVHDKVTDRNVTDHFSEICYLTKSIL
jgi:hypothetical protein